MITDFGFWILPACRRGRDFGKNVCKEIAGKLKKMERKYNHQFADVYEALNYLMHEKQKQDDLENRKQIGFKK